MKIGIVGLPNVGKSTLFNALTKSATAQVANYPFCTIDPNVGMVDVPDKRIAKLSEMVTPERLVPAVVEFVDIAGLVKGASKGEGLGNQFLAKIRECDAIGQVLRFFKDNNVIHVHDKVDAKRDMEIIETELILSDLQTLEKRLGKAKNDAKSGNKEKEIYVNLLEKIKTKLNEGGNVIDLDLNNEEKMKIIDLHLLTCKPFLYILNVTDTDLQFVIIDQIKQNLNLPKTAKVVLISAKMEAELLDFNNEEADEYLESMVVSERGLNKLIKEAYDILGLQTYFTAGPKEVRAWTIHKGDTAPQAAGVIHSDFEKNFIRAEVISYEDYVACGGENGAKEKGLLKIEGKDYMVKDGDIIHFRHT